MFKLVYKDGDYLFTGTEDQFADCFFTNVEYEEVIEFAEGEECVVEEYTAEEHAEFLRVHGKRLGLI